MAYSHRLIAGLLWAALMACMIGALPAVAQTTSTPQAPTTQYNGNYSTMAWQSTGAGGCSDWMSYNNGLAFGSGAGFKSANVTTISWAGGGNCTYSYTSQTGVAGGPTTGLVLNVRQWCATSNVAPVSGTCTATTPTGSCADLNGKTQDFSFTVTYANKDAYQAPANLCEDQWGMGTTRSGSTPQFCSLTKTSGYGISVCYGGNCQVGATYKYTGSTCTPTAGGGGTTPTNADSAGTPTEPGTDPTKCTGTFNNVTVVHTCAETNETVTKSISPTTTSTTSTTTTGVPAGTTTNTTISCVAEGSCTKTVTTTTTTNTGAQTKETAITSGDKGSLCQGTTGLKTCAGTGGANGEGGDKESAFGGSCGAGFACSGDAAFCAVAKATNETKCLLDAKGASEIAVYDSAKNAGTATGIQTANVALTNASFDQTNLLGVGASCITDKVVTVAGSSISIPFSSICPHLATLGTIMLAISFLSAFVIIGRPS